MKQLKVSVLILSVLAGSAVFATASTENFTAYRFSVTSLTSSLSFPAVNASYWEVTGLPVVAVTNGMQSQANVNMDTDASGKIVGSGYLQITQPSSNSLVTGFTVDCSGKISMSGITPLVTMNIKGNGGTYDGSSAGSGMNATSDKISLKFTGKVGADPYNPNDVVGTISGTVQGASAIGIKSSTLKNIPARITAYEVKAVSFDGEGVLQNSKNTKMTLVGESNTGTGTIDKYLNYKATVKGIGWAKGSSFSLMGVLTNYPANGGLPSFLAPCTVNITQGIIDGQTVSGEATNDRISAYLVH